MRSERSRDGVERQVNEKDMREYSRDQKETRESDKKRDKRKMRE